MKALFNAFISLWKQAPLWRFCFIIFIGGLVMAAFFPTAGLKRHAPWLPGNAPHHLPSAHHHGTPEGQESAENGPAGQPPVHLQYPSMAEIVRDHVTLAGHDLPLPKGDWHPILSAQVSSESPFSFLALVRTRQGAVTGLIIAQATQQPVSPERLGNPTGPCHDDRNLLNHSLPLTPSGEDCIGVGIVTIEGNDVSNNLLINQSILRLQALGITPIPPIFLAVQWRHIAIMADGQAQVGVVDTLIPPLDQQTHQLLAPLPAWLKGALAPYPAAREFLTQMRSWAPDWQAALRLGFDNQRAGHVPRDPEAP